MKTNITFRTNKEELDRVLKIYLETLSQ